jgi:hypothetical protein
MHTSHKACWLRMWWHERCVWVCIREWTYQPPCVWVCMREWTYQPPCVWVLHTGVDLPASLCGFCIREWTDQPPCVGFACGSGLTSLPVCGFAYGSGLTSLPVCGFAYGSGPTSLPVWVCNRMHDSGHTILSLCAKMPCVRSAQQTDILSNGLICGEHAPILRTPSNVGFLCCQISAQARQQNRRHTSTSRWPSGLGHG